MGQLVSDAERRDDRDAEPRLDSRVDRLDPQQLGNRAELGRRRARIRQDAPCDLARIAPAFPSDERFRRKLCELEPVVVGEAMSRRRDDHEFVLAEDLEQEVVDVHFALNQLDVDMPVVPSRRHMACVLDLDEDPDLRMRPGEVRQAGVGGDIWRP